MFDLHMHSIHSRDGELDEKKLLEHARKHGIQTIAVCDHNSTKAVPKLMELAVDLGIVVIPGVECDALFEGMEVHILGYGIDPCAPYFMNLDEQINEMMIESNRERMELLNQHHGFSIDIEAMMKKCEGSLVPFMIVVDELLKDEKYQDFEILKPYRPGGSRSDVPNVNFYWDLCSVGTPCYVKVAYPTLEKTVAEIKKAGGMAFIAHPFRNFFQQDNLLLKAKECGVVGIEVFSNYHDEEQRMYYLDFANRHGLFISCGSDFHGAFKPTIEMGEYGPKDMDYMPYLDQFKQALQNK